MLIVRTCKKHIATYSWNNIIGILSYKKNLNYNNPQCCYAARWDARSSPLKHIGLFTMACYSRVNDHIWNSALLLALVGLVGAYCLYIGLPLKIGLCQTSHLHNYFAWNQFSIGIIQTLNGKYYCCAYLMSSFYAYCISLFVCSMYIRGAFGK